MAGLVPCGCCATGWTSRGRTATAPGAVPSPLKLAAATRGTISSVASPVSGSWMMKRALRGTLTLLSIARMTSTVKSWSRSVESTTPTTTPLS